MSHHPVRMNFSACFSDVMKSKSALIFGVRRIWRVARMRQLRDISRTGPSTRTRSGSLSPIAVGSGARAMPDFAA